ncbi:DUF2975 domain-containing protein [Salicibibacter cibi]|uniref:DUF2975 domain-containing protein n=1 Tax=Salicibibacter cibi TaxID=2743001 RepID=A0A7T7CGQ6_9BACI|nr:DUF2975 domain-containing protein [Salicibibacter cibi]QQK81425.1 DUF2975 domain-containing protein [Salicibibacter cibi]
MTKGKKIFYKVMHIISIIGIIGMMLGVLFLTAIWIFQPVGDASSYSIGLGVFSFDIPQEVGFFFSHMFFVSLIVMLLLLIALLMSIRKFFKNLSNKYIFIQQNANNIRNVGWILIFLSFLSNVPAIILANDFVGSVDFSNVPFSISYDMEYGMLFAGIAILAVAQIFNQAVKIAEENQLTI